MTGHDDELHPDPERARAELERVRRQRGRVEKLVEALLSEKRRNHFAANVFAMNPREKS